MLLNRRLSVAPMMDWTDRHCRMLHRRLAPEALLYTEMVTSAALRHGQPERLLAHHAEEHPVALQLGGSDPVELAAAARLGAEAGFDEINLNLGCPSDRVQAGRFGACLMREPALVAECLQALIEAVAVPVTAKCRLGVDDQDTEETLDRFVTSVAAAGCRVLVVHARKAWLKGLNPRQNRELPPLDYPRVYRLKKDFPALCIVLNGGLTEVLDCVQALDHVDGVMLGRTAYHLPWRLAELSARLSGTAPESPEAVLLGLRPYIEAEMASGTPFWAIGRHLLGLFHGRPGARAFRRLLSERGTRPGADFGLLEQGINLIQHGNSEAA